MSRSWPHPFACRSCHGTQPKPTPLLPSGEWLQKYFLERIHEPTRFRYGIIRQSTDSNTFNTLTPDSGAPFPSFAVTTLTGRTRQPKHVSTFLSRTLEIRFPTQSRLRHQSSLSKVISSPQPNLTRVTINNHNHHNLPQQPTLTSHHSQQSWRANDNYELCGWRFYWCLASRP